MSVYFSSHQTIQKFYLCQSNTILITMGRKIPTSLQYNITLDHNLRRTLEWMDKQLKKKQMGH